MMDFPWEEISSLIRKWFIFKQIQVSQTWKQLGWPKKAGCICGMSVFVFIFIVIKVVKVIVGAVKIVCRQKRRQPHVERRNGARREIQGIPNIGNTCYMNAVLQMFYRTPHFRERLQQAVEKKWNQVGYWEFLTQLIIPPTPKIDIAILGLMDAMTSESPVPPQFPPRVLNAVRKIDETFLGNKQQDSYQFFNAVMEGLEDCSQWRTKINPNETATETLMNNSPVSRLFGGIFCTIYTYDTCKHMEPVFQRYTSIPVQVGPKADDENPALPPHVATDQLNQPKQQQLDESDKSTGSEQKQESEQEATDQPNQSQQQQLDESDRLEGENSSCPSITTQEEMDQPNQSQQQLDESNRLESENSPLQQDVTDQTKMPTEQQLDESDSCTESTQQKQLEKNRNCTPDPPPCHRRLRNLPEILTDLEKGLEMWTDIECFQDLSCRLCEKKGITKEEPVVSRSRTLLMALLPPVLVFQFNRFEKGFNGTLEKMDGMLSYPECFDMAPYCSNVVEVLNRMTGSDSGEYRYRLYGVVSHRGSSRGGHYIARVRKSGSQQEEQWQDPERFKDDMMQFWKGKKQLSDYKPTESTPDTWYTINDTLVNEDKSKTALRDPNACLLFYERV